MGTFDVVDVMKLLIFLSSFITSLVPILYFCVMGILRRNITRMESLLYKEVWNVFIYFYNFLSDKNKKYAHMNVCLSQSLSSKKTL